MNRFRRVATCSIIAALTFAATSAHAVPISSDSFWAHIASQRGKTTAARQPARQAQAQTHVVCTTKRTVTKARLFGKRTIVTKVCTPVTVVPSSVPGNVPAGQGPAVGTGPGTGGGADASVASTPAASSSGSGSSTSSSRPRSGGSSAPPNGNAGGNSTPPSSNAGGNDDTPAPNGNAGGNSTNVDSHSYVSPVFSTPPLFVPGAGDSEHEEVPVFVAPTPPTNEVPEPGTLALLGAGLAGLGLVRRRATK